VGWLITLRVHRQSSSGEHGLCAQKVIRRKLEEGVMERFVDQISATEALGLSRAKVCAILPEAVVVSAPGRELQPCDVLESGTHASLVDGDSVLVWFPQNPQERGIILGQVHPSPLPAVAHELTDELVIEAKHSLTLRVGDGSITIREDGKILIKGKDLVSHAQRLNRIKGGAVQIN